MDRFESPEPSSRSYALRVLLPKEYDLQSGPKGDERLCAEQKTCKGDRNNDRSVKHDEEDRDRTECAKSGSGRGGPRRSGDARVVGQDGIAVFGPYHSTVTRARSRPKFKQLRTCSAL